MTDEKMIALGACSECFADIKGAVGYPAPHARQCYLASVADWKKHYENQKSFHEKEIERYEGTIKFLNKWVKKNSERAMLFEGKYNILRHENNKLRRANESLRKFRGNASVKCRESANGFVDCLELENYDKL